MSVSVYPGSEMFSATTKTAILRISAHDDGGSTIFNVEGKLTASVASELEGLWKATLERNPLRSFVVKLAAVSFIDAESKELLSRMHRQGVSLIPTGCLMKAIVAQIEAESRATRTERSL